MFYYYYYIKFSTWRERIEQDITHALVMLLCIVNFRFKTSTISLLTAACDRQWYLMPFVDLRCLSCERGKLPRPKTRRSSFKQMEAQRSIRRGSHRLPRRQSAGTMLPIFSSAQSLL